MSAFNKLAIAAVGIILGMSASPAQAAILGASDGGNVMIKAPNSTDINQTTSNLMQGFNEKQNVLLQEQLEVDFNKFIEAGTIVNSHMIFLDSAGSQDVTQNNIKWTFDGEILGIMSDSGGILEGLSNTLLGAEGTTYPAFAARGLETDERSGNRKYSVDGNELTLSMRVTNPGDWVRVVTRANPQSVQEPTSMLGLFAVGVFGTASTLKYKKKQEA